MFVRRMHVHKQCSIDYFDDRTIYGKNAIIYATQRASWWLLVSTFTGVCLGTKQVPPVFVCCFI